MNRNTESMKNINNRMVFVGKKIAVCNHFCKNKPRNTNFYAWYSFFDKELIKEMCQTCALRESWGGNYKQTTNYKKWIESKND